MDEQRVVIFPSIINNNNKICQTHEFNSTHVGWVKSGWTYVMDQVGLNFFDPP